MRLVPASPTPPRRIPSRGPRPAAPPPEPEPAAAPTVTPRQGLGWPLVGEAPGGRTAARAAAARPPAGSAAGSATAGRAAGPPARWQVTFDTGEQFEVRGLTLVGRRPEPRPGEPVKRLVTCPRTT